MMEYGENGRWFLLIVMIGNSVGGGTNAASDYVQNKERNGSSLTWNKNDRKQLGAAEC